MTRSQYVFLWFLSALGNMFNVAFGFIIGFGLFAECVYIERLVGWVSRLISIVG